MTLRLVASAGLAVAVAAIAAGCGASADLSSVAKAANKTEDAKTVRFSISVKQQGVPDSAGDGVLDFAANSGRVAMREVGGSSFEVIWNGSTYYVKGLPLVGNGKPWLKVTDSSDFAAYTTTALFNPARLFALLQKAGDFEAAGTDTVRGVSTTRYDGSVDAKKFADEFVPATADDEDSSPTPTGTFPVTVWIDQDGLVRKAVFDFPDAGPDDPGGELAYELYDFGQLVVTSPPPADQVGEPDLPSSTDSLRTFTATLQIETTYKLEPMTTGG